METNQPIEVKEKLPKSSKRQRITSYFKIAGIIAAILLIVFVVSRPAVINFYSTLKTYLSGSVQTKAWNEAKRQNLERDIKSKSEELERIKPTSFWIPTARAAELPPKIRPELNKKVETYLRSYKSPLADYTDLLLEQPTWKKIVSLSFAESSMCIHYPKATQNCWGIGGSNLWDFGDNLGDGIVGANKFLLEQPGRSKVKYADMSIEQMNGLYKQPYGAHWSINNYKILLELDQLEINSK